MLYYSIILKYIMLNLNEKISKNNLKSSKYKGPNIKKLNTRKNSSQNTLFRGYIK